MIPQHPGWSFGSSRKASSSVESHVIRWASWAPQLTNGLHYFPGVPPLDLYILGNVLCCRFSMMVLICIGRGVVWGLENPERTAINHVPPIDLILQSFLRPLTVKWHLWENKAFYFWKDAFLFWTIPGSPNWNVGDESKVIASFCYPVGNASKVHGSLWNVFR